MAKFQVTFVLLFVLLAVFSCDGQRQRVRAIRLQRNRQLARQEVEQSVTPYPSADELKPEIPFNEAAPAPEPADEPAVVDVGVETPIDDAPEVAANEPIPDEVYGPPEVAVLFNTPDEVYGPPEIDANLLPSDVVLARQRQRNARLVQVRRQAAYRQARLAKLRAAQLRRSA